VPIKRDHDGRLFGFSGPSYSNHNFDLLLLEMASTGAGVYAPTFGAGGGQSIVRTLTGQSRRSNHQEDREKTDNYSNEDLPISKADDWVMMPNIKSFQNQNTKSNFKGRGIGVTWKNLNVKGVGADAAFHENVFSQFNIPKKIGEARRGSPTKTILEDCHGHVAPGEMLLVLGRPGAGCTTLLKILSNRRSGYAQVEGDVHFGTLDHQQAKRYKGQIVMNSEEELFFPTLTVGQTVDFATRMKVPFHLPEGTADSDTFQQRSAEFLLKSMGISHTRDTKVGNEFVRGVSGGERKRVSIIECMATRGSVFCWDNSTRGLDASTALEYTRAIRALTDVLRLATIVTLYQAGNGIYNLFDKVLILDEGKEIYYGPTEQARPYMEELGFVCDDAANIADFLTGVTVPTERHIRDDYKDRFPRTAEEIRGHYLKTPIKAEMEKEYSYPETDVAKANTEDFQEAVHSDKHKSLPQGSPLTTSLVSQVRACVIRQYQIIWGDKATFIIKQGATLIQALIAGSLFYMAPANSSGLFLKGGALFFSLLYNSLMAMSEVTDSFTGRPVLAKHKAFAM
jgi:ATP-binding cassette subfamily G (WHITE) protein 2 (SNQ2)